MGRRFYYYCETCGEDYANNLEDYAPEDFVTLLSDSRVSLKIVPQDGDNSSSNDLIIHADNDDDVTSLPDVNASQELSSATLASVPPRIASEDVINSPDGQQSASSSSLQCINISLSPTGNSQTNTSSQLVSSLGDNALMEEDIDSSKLNSLQDVQDNISLQDSSIVTPPFHPTTCNDIVDQEVIVSSHADPSSSHSVVVTATSNSSAHHSDNHGTPNISSSTSNVTTIAPSWCTKSSQQQQQPAISSSQVTPLQTMDDGVNSSTLVDNAANISSNVTMEDGNYCRRTPGRDAKLNRMSFTCKDKHKVVCTLCCMLLIIISYVTETVVQAVEGGITGEWIYPLSNAQGKCHYCVL